MTRALLLALALAACSSSPPGPPGGLPSHSEGLYRSCAEARNAGAAPITQGDAGYRPELDRDGDGVACDG